MLGKNQPYDPMSLTNETTVPPADALTDALARWRKTVEAELKGASFDKRLVTRTFEGIALQPLYTRADLAHLPALDTRPGEAPYLRGVRAHGFKEHRWEAAQEIAAGTPAEFNAALLADLMHGQDSVVLTLDAATRGAVAGEYAGGLAVGSLADLTTALAGVDLSAVPVHLRTGADAMPLAALYVALARERGVALAKLSGSVTADPLGGWAETGRSCPDLTPLYDSLAQWTQWADTVNPLPSLVDTSFPKGAALASWLQGIGATTTLGAITLEDTYHVVTGVNAPTSRWLYSTSPATLQTFSFNTPLGVADTAQCGRVAYSNFHIASSSGGDGVYPAECTPGPLTPQEKVMEFMLLDLASCVQTDTVPPTPPPIVK